MEIAEQNSKAGTEQAVQVACLQNELLWLEQWIDVRIKSYFSPEQHVALLPGLPPFQTPLAHYAGFAKSNNLTVAERLLLIMSFATVLKPQLFDVFQLRNSATERRYTEFGGVIDANGQFQPTGETFLFLVAGNDLEQRLLFMPLLNADAFLFQFKVLRLEMGQHDNRLQAKLVLDKDYQAWFMAAEADKPEFNEEFPARLVSTQLEWDDIVLAPDTRTQVEEIAEWIEHGPALMKNTDLGRRLKPGYKALFYGPPGTGKTLTAAMIGKATGFEVFKVDLSLMVSKYIGETEKNLAKVFNRADRKNWILFFDEADALFGKRTDVSSSHDRYANQEVAYLLQRIEEHHGIVILATNLKDNIDQAFLRRFQAVIHFPMPGPEERLALWQQAFPQELKLAPDVDLEAIANKHEIAGGVIINVVRYASLKAIRNGGNEVKAEDIRHGLSRELQKEGIMFI